MLMIAGSLICCLWCLLLLRGVDIEERRGVRPAKYKVSGRVILSAVQQEQRRVFRFFNDVSGEVNINEALSSVEALGAVRVSLHGGESVLADIDGPDIVQQKGILERMLDLGTRPIATIRIDNLTGLRGEHLAIGSAIRGHLRGALQVVGIVQPLDVPVKITRFSQDTYIVEPIGGLVFSLQELGIAREVEYLLEVKPYTLGDPLRLYFKFLLEQGS